MELFSLKDWLSISLVILIMGMSKGGFPVSGIALPLLVLLWPEQTNAARAAVSFMLPLLCAMDVVGAWMYRKTIDWSHIKSLLPGMLLGVFIASIFFVTEDGIAVPDRILKLAIGILGLSFSFWNLLGKPSAVLSSPSGNRTRPTLYGFAAGLTSTIAHAAGPVMQMYFLPTKLSKQVFAGTTVYFFLLLNAVKLIPFTLFGRFNKDHLIINFWLLPLIPVGVITGFFLVRLMRQDQYLKFIHFTLAATSLILIIKAM